MLTVTQHLHARFCLGKLPSGVHSAASRMALSPLLLALVFLGGVLTIITPCILPVLPFVFARTGRPFATSGLPMLVGMALTFAAVATLAATGGAWAVQA